MNKQVQIKRFDNDNGTEFRIAKELKTGSLWVLLHDYRCTRSRWNSNPNQSKFRMEGKKMILPERDTITDTLEKNTTIMILTYNPKLHDHLIKFLSGKYIYSCCIPRGSLRRLFGLLIAPEKQYDIVQNINK